MDEIADIFPKTEDKITPLHLATRGGHTAVKDLIIKYIKIDSLTIYFFLKVERILAAYFPFTQEFTLELVSKCPWTLTLVYFHMNHLLISS